METANTQPIKKIVFDIETQRTFDEVGGFQNREKLGVSYVGVYSYTTNQLHGFFEDDLPLLEQILLKERPMLIGFNSIHFDVPVLQPYMKKLDLASLPQLDILRDIEAVLGHRLKLDSVAQTTLFSGKSGSGLDAIRWYREGDLASLAKYCLDDVKATRDLYEFGMRHGNIYYMTGGEKKPIPMQWGAQPFIIHTMQEAFKMHTQLQIEYMEVDDTGARHILVRTVDVLSLDGGKFTAFCHELNRKETFLIANIWKVADTGKIFAHQRTLF